MRRIPATSAACIFLFLPSRAIISTGVQIVPHLELSSASRLRIFFLYCLTSLLSVNISTTSLTEKYHSSVSSFHTVLIFLSSNICILLSICITSIKEFYHNIFLSFVYQTLESVNNLYVTI